MLLASNRLYSTSGLRQVKVIPLFITLIPGELTAAFDSGYPHEVHEVLAVQFKHAIIDGPLYRSTCDLPECRSDWDVASSHVG